MLNKLIKKIEDIIIVLAVIAVMFFAINKISLISQQINYSSVVLSFAVLAGLGVLLINVIIFCLSETKKIMRIDNVHKLNASKKMIWILWMVVVFTTLIAIKFLLMFIEANNKMPITLILEIPLLKYLILFSFIVASIIFTLISIYIIFNMVLKFQIKKINTKDKTVMIGFSKKLINHEELEEFAELIHTENYLLFFKIFYIPNDSEELEVTTIFSEKLKENKKAQTPPEV